MKIIRFVFYFFFAIILLVIAAPWIFSILEVIGPGYEKYTEFVRGLFGH